jgi:sugar O-acyltransferase (sialic acid O-acetyltransferase NeuD family)
MKKALIGAGGFAREIMSHMGMVLTCFIDDKYWDNKNWNIYPLSMFDPNNYEVLIAIGDCRVRENIWKRLPKETRFFSFIHPSVHLLDLHTITIGEGSVITANCILTTNIVIGKHCHLNLGTTIGHDCNIGDCFTTAPGVNISGTNNIGNNVYLGTNTSTREKITICDNVIVGLNSGVVKDITEPGIYGGVPAKRIK